MNPDVVARVLYRGWGRAFTPAERRLIEEMIDQFALLLDEPGFDLVKFLRITKRGT